MILRCHCYNYWDKFPGDWESKHMWRRCETRQRGRVSPLLRASCVLSSVHVWCPLVLKTTPKRQVAVTQSTDEVNGKNKSCWETQRLATVGRDKGRHGGTRAQRDSRSTLPSRSHGLGELQLPRIVGAQGGWGRVRWKYIMVPLSSHCLIPCWCPTAQPTWKPASKGAWEKQSAGSVAQDS